MLAVPENHEHSVLTEKIFLFSGLDFSHATNSVPVWQGISKMVLDRIG